MDWNFAAGRGLLATKTREAYGVTDEEAERQIKSFEARNPTRVP